METQTRLFFENAARMKAVEDESVDLVVTSPPYPMIEMWDEQFFTLDEKTRRQFEAERYEDAFDGMHAALKTVWAECARTLRAGGLMCVNVGDAVRTLGGDFRLWPNGARTQAALSDLGLNQLPGILWRKPANSPAKFMGSGMIPPNAYVTLEHERILIFRKERKRRVERRADRYESAYFWEERNRWFSDVWTDLTGTSQSLKKHGANGASEDLRERSGAFPLALPLRLVLMFSIYGDCVLDPFLGTGTTALAAAVAGRHAIGFEVDAAFRPAVEERLRGAPSLSHALNRKRLEAHRTFLKKREKPCKYESEHYGFGVITKQELKMRLYDTTSLEQTEESYFTLSYAPHVAQREMFAVSEPTPA